MACWGASTTTSRSGCGPASRHRVGPAERPDSSEPAFWSMPVADEQQKIAAGESTGGPAFQGARALFVSPIDMRQNNGMAQLQLQLLQMLCTLYRRVDLFSMGALPPAARRWIRAQ